MAETIATLALVLLLIVAFAGLTLRALLLLLYAAFAALVYAHRLGPDPLASIAIALMVFVTVTALVGQGFRAVSRGVRTLFA
jgi:hypothetical protein